MELDELPEFDIVDARSYYSDGSSPSMYFDECLSEHSDDGDDLSDLS